MEAREKGSHPSGWVRVVVVKNVSYQEEGQVEGGVS